MAELSSLQQFASKVAELLPLVSKAVSYDHYTHHTNMKETVCQRVSKFIYSYKIIVLRPVCPMVYGRVRLVTFLIMLWVGIHSSGLRKA